MELLKLLSKYHVEFKTQISGEKLSTFKTGGIAKIVCYPKNIKETRKVFEIAKQYDMPINIIGNGSNTLIKDSGYDGILVSTQKQNTCNFYEDTVYAFSGLQLNNLIKKCLEKELSGLEALVGIPATFGGALFMNAGAFGTCIGDKVQYVDILTDGDVKRIYEKDCKFGYRSSVFNKISNCVILGASLKLKKDCSLAIGAKMEHYKKIREVAQPQEPSLGSVFLRGENYYPAKLIEQCGLKGFKVNGAMVSTKHSGFIVNTGKASTNDYIMLTELIRCIVKDKYDIELKKEIKILGD